ncbi:uncharacterized protein PV06_08562 [Exophiala oligosperma]|uniref:Uncharacterized protein n=1 Tax=Exophiala oligosperma TaxID=215243 RepID=A0A0D2DC73_9EURO|nr:uncharacterized protein PV06_08562 [Exophiala oligosperma]KIW40005.1 hypothetical protein PV06_08562 [Exophiala oligosperma]
MPLEVYKVAYKLALADPDIPGPRYHTVLFVRTKTNGDGIVHHVTGDIVSGMQYQSRPAKRPEDSQTFHSKELLGVVEPTDYPGVFDQTCRQQPPPPRQKRFNPATHRTEQMKPDGSFYEQGEMRSPMVKCTEWTERQAIPALLQNGIIKPR